MATNRPTPTPDGPQPARRLGWRRPALVAGAVAAIALLGQEAANGLTTFVAWVGDFGAWAPVVFITGYALCVAVFVPGSILTIAGGALFGAPRGAARAVSAQRARMGGRQRDHDHGSQGGARSPARRLPR